MGAVVALETLKNKERKKKIGSAHYPMWWFSNWVELRDDNENFFTIKFQGQSPKCKICETSQVNEIVKNTQLSLSHSCTIARSVCRCQGNEMQNYRNCRYFGIASL